MSIIDGLYDRLVTDLKLIGMPVQEVELQIRPFSKTYYGRYFPSSDKTPARVRIYPYLSKSNDKIMDYSTILYHTVHEMCHHLQYTNEKWRKKKGVMHDPEFYGLLNKYVDRAENLGMIDKEVVAL